MYKQRDSLTVKFVFFLMLLILLTVDMQIFAEPWYANVAENLFDEDYYHKNIRGTSPHQIPAGGQSLYV